MTAPEATVVSFFPPGYFLENVESVPGGGLLVSVATRSELYFVPPSDNGPVSPILLQQFPADQMTFGIVRAPQSANVFYVLTSDFLGTGSRRAYLNVLDLQDVSKKCRASSIMTFPLEATGLNGFCALSDNVLIAADSFGCRIWRIDLDRSSFPPKSATASTWLSHDTMRGKLVLPDFQPGVNGLKYSAVTGCVYYTSTQLRLICRVSVDSETLQPRGSVDILARGMQGDDLIVDDTVSPPVAYVTTHRDNTVLRVPLDEKSEIALAALQVVGRGSMEDDKFVGPTAGVWEYGKKGRTAYFTTDGGLKNPLEDGALRCAKVVRLRVGR